MRQPYYIAAGALPHLRLASLQKRSGRYVIHLFYHTVSDTHLAHITPLYRHRTTDEFRRDLDWLQQHFTPIRWTEAAAYEAHKQPAFCLTFDDGLREFYDTVAPILLERKIPCVNFLNSAFIGNADCMYRYKAALIISTLQQQGKLTNAARKHLLSVTYAERDTLDIIAREAGVDIQGYLQQQRIYMTYDQVRELEQQGFEFGNHSVNHPHYSDLTFAEQLEQTKKCAEELRKNLSKPTNVFSYPFGQESLRYEDIDQLCSLYDAVFGTNNLRLGCHPRFYNRIWMEGYRYSARQIIMGEYLRYLLRR